MDDLIFFAESLELLSATAPAAAQQITQAQLSEEQRAALQLVLSQVPLAAPVPSPSSLSQPP